MIAEVNKFSGHLGVVVLLKEESFRERHWQVFEIPYTFEFIYNYNSSYGMNCMSM